MTLLHRSASGHRVLGAVLGAALLVSGVIAASQARAGQGFVAGEGGALLVDDGYPYGLLGGGWLAQRSDAYQGPSGLYSCAQGRIRTDLARKACGGTKFPNRFF